MKLVETLNRFLAENQMHRGADVISSLQITLSPHAYYELLDQFGFIPPKFTKIPTEVTLDIAGVNILVTKSQKLKEPLEFKGIDYE